MEIPFFVGFIGSWLGISGGIYGLFNKAGDNVNQETKKQVADWLQNLEFVKDLSNWPTTFAILFDQVFTEKHRSWKCFFRSSLASFFAVITITLILVYTSPRIYADLYLWGVDYETISFLIVLSLLLLVVPDYISLLETRYIIKKMGDTNSGVRWILLLLFDLILTPAIFVIISSLSVLGYVMVERLIDGLSFTSIVKSAIRGFSELYEMYLDALFFNSRGSIAFYSTFFTSIWIWLYVASGVTMKFITFFKKGLSFLQKHLDIKNKPFKAMGFTSILGVSIFYIILGFYLIFWVE